MQNTKGVQTNMSAAYRRCGCDEVIVHNSKLARKQFKVAKSCRPNIIHPEVLLSFDQRLLKCRSIFLLNTSSAANFQKHEIG